MSQNVKTNDAAKTMSTVNDNNVKLVEADRSAPAASLRGAAFFTETFSNGLEGDNGVGPFTTSDSGGEGDPIWRMADEFSPCGEFSNPATQALVSTTADNGYMIYDTDCWNTPIAEGVFDNGSKTSATAVSHLLQCHWV